MNLNGLNEIKFTVDKATAEICLKVVEKYLYDTCGCIYVVPHADGSYSYTLSKLKEEFK